MPKRPERKALGSLRAEGPQRDLSAPAAARERFRGFVDIEHVDPAVGGVVHVVGGDVAGLPDAAAGQEQNERGQPRGRDERSRFSRRAMRTKSPCRPRLSAVRSLASQIKWM